MTTCPRCGHAIERHLGGVCSVGIDELPSCLDCREPLETLLGTVYPLDSDATVEP